MTNNWVDIKTLILLSFKAVTLLKLTPVSFRWAIEAKKNGAKIIVVDPRFNRTASVADLHAQFCSGTDIAFLMGVIRYLLETNPNPTRIR